MQPDSMILKLLKTSPFQALLAAATLLVTANTNLVHAEAAEKPEGDESPWWDSKWPTRKKLVIDTSDKGATIAEPIRSGTCSDLPSRRSMRLRLVLIPIILYCTDRFAYSRTSQLFHAATRDSLVESESSNKPIAS